MPRKQKFKPGIYTLNERYKYNPYFYNLDDTQNVNNPKYNSFIREIRCEFRSLKKENLYLKNQLVLKQQTIEKLEADNAMQKETIEMLKLKLLRKENEHRNKDEYLEGENATLKDENEKLEEKIRIYNEAIGIYQKEMAMKITGQVKPDLDPFLLNFN